MFRYGGRGVDEAHERVDFGRGGAVKTVRMKDAAARLYRAFVGAEPTEAFAADVARAAMYDAKKRVAAPLHIGSA